MTDRIYLNTPDEVEGKNLSMLQHHPEVGWESTLRAWTSRMPPRAARGAAESDRR